MKELSWAKLRGVGDFKELSVSWCAGVFTEKVTRASSWDKGGTRLCR